MSRRGRSSRARYGFPRDLYPMDDSSSISSGTLGSKYDTMLVRPLQKCKEHLIETKTPFNEASIVVTSEIYTFLVPFVKSLTVDTNKQVLALVFLATALRDRRLVDYLAKKDINAFEYLYSMITQNIDWNLAGGVRWMTRDYRRVDILLMNSNCY